MKHAGFETNGGADFHDQSATPDKLMSLWRKEASKRLPELQRIIAARVVDNPMMLWIELLSEFDRLCGEQPLPVGLLKRIWEYAKWCMEQGHVELATAAALGFCEHLLGSDATQRVLPRIMTRHDYEGLRELLLYHNSEAQFTLGLKRFDNPFRA